jgi:uncharacterized protein YacL
LHDTALAARWTVCDAHAALERSSYALGGLGVERGTNFADKLMMALWVIRTFFLILCAVAGYAVSQYRPEIINGGVYGLGIGLSLGSLLIGIDQLLKGFSLRAFSAATFGLMLGTTAAWLIDRTQLFIYADERTRWLIRLGLFLAFGYLGMILAMRSNKEDFSLLIPYIRFRSQNKPENVLVLDTSAIIDGRIVELIEGRFLEGIIVVPKFVLHELQFIADSADATRRARGQRGLDILNRIRQNPRSEVRIHEMDFPEEKDVDSKLLKLTSALEGKLFTTDFNLGKVAELQSVPHLNLTQLVAALKPTVLPGDIFNLRVVREGRDKGQGVGYLNDGTMVVVNGAQSYIGQQVQVQVQTLLQTGAGVMIFADLRLDAAA